MGEWGAQARASLARAAFSTARRVGRQRWVAPVFCLLHPVVPLRHVVRMPGVIAVGHPRPSWPDHVVIVPTRVSRGLLADEPAEQRGRAVAAILAAARRSSSPQD